MFDMSGMSNTYPTLMFGLTIFYDFVCSSMLNDNCILNSMQLLLDGDNSLKEELRCLTSIELYLTLDESGKHDVFQ